MISLVVFDHSTISAAFVGDVDAELKDLLTRLRSRGLRLVLFATDWFDLQTLLAEKDLPQFDLMLTSKDVGAQKGSPLWVSEVGRRMGALPNEILYVGDGKFDLLTAINSGVFYLQAAWSTQGGTGLTALVVDRPLDVYDFATHFLLQPPRWEYQLDSPEYGLRVRSLLDQKTRLPSTNVPDFSLQDVFSRDKAVVVGENSARDVLMFHALSSLWLEGLIEPRSLFGVYPSSTAGHTDPVMAEFLVPAAKILGAHFKSDVLIRAVSALDTSLERWKAGQQRRPPAISYATQTDSVHLNPRYRQSKLLKGRRVVVFDNFTTTGMSLDWARNLFLAAGASEVVCLTVGKYTDRFVVRTPRPGVDIGAFELKNYPEAAFATAELHLARDIGMQNKLVELFQLWRDGKAVDD